MAGQRVSERMGEVVGLIVTLEPNTDVRVGDGIELRGSLEFRLLALGAVGQVASSPNGEALLKALHELGKRVTILETRKGNAVTEMSPEGGEITVFYNPGCEAISKGGEEWATRPPALGLAHSLVRAEQIARGTVKKGSVSLESTPSPTDPTQAAEARESDLEAIGIEPFDLYPFSENKIREGWKPPQPPRTKY